MTFDAKLSLFAALAVLQGLDTYTTSRVLEQGGRELNPALAKLMAVLGPLPAMLITKGLLMAAVWWQFSGVPLWTLVLLCALYLAVVISNARLIK